MDETDAVYEFFAPFCHIEGKYEWCRIRSPTHGAFNVFIELGASTKVPATVYVEDDAGANFMAQRYPECTTHRARRVTISEEANGFTVNCYLNSDGPIKEAQMVFKAKPGIPTQVPYGGDGPVWGGQFDCWGVDLNLKALTKGMVRRDEGIETLSQPGILTLGSFGKITKRASP
ncbi:MAG: hypothetical protein ACPHK8_05400 [Thermoplasmatota archaeon]